MNKSQLLLGAVAVIVIGIAVLAILSNFVSFTPARTAKDTFFTLKCANAECSEVFKSSVAELAKDAEDAFTGTPGNPGYTCPKCGQRTGYTTMLCPECGERFLPEYHRTSGAKPGVPECPKCGWSPKRYRKQSKEKK